MPMEFMPSLDSGAGSEGYTYGRQPQLAQPTGINWQEVLKSLGAAQSTRQTAQAGQQLTPAQLPGSTVQTHQLAIPPLLGQEHPESSAGDIAQYAKIVAALFGGG